MPYEVFISYAHEDREMRKELDKHLRLLNRLNTITSWTEGDIDPGTEWEPQITEHLNKAAIILLLISPDFIGSDFCYSTEMNRAIERHDADEACVIPIVLRPVYWEGAPFSKLRVLPSNGKPITAWDSQDQAFEDVVRGIVVAIENLSNRDKIFTCLASSLISSTSTSEGMKQVPLLYPTSIWNVPFRRNHFFTGREDTLDKLHALLTREYTSIVSLPIAISGLAGMGKTQIAVEYAYRYEQEYQYVLWVQADAYEILTASYLTVAHLLGFPEQNKQNQSRVVNAVKCWLEAHTDWLLILDNADDFPLIDKFLPQRNRGHILITTRASAVAGWAQCIEIDKMDTEESLSFSSTSC